MESVLLFSVEVDLSEKVDGKFSVTGDAVGCLNLLTGMISLSLALLSVRGLLGVDGMSLRSTVLNFLSANLVALFLVGEGELLSVPLLTLWWYLGA